MQRLTLEQRITNYKGRYKTHEPHTFTIAEFDLLTVNINAERELIKMLHSSVIHSSTKDQLRTVISLLRGE